MTDLSPAAAASADPDRKIREQLLAMAKSAGAEHADVIAIRSRHLDVSVRNGKVEDASSAESFGIGLRIFKGHSHAYGSTADKSPDGLQRLARQVSDMASVVPEDTYTRLALPQECAKNIPALDLVDPTPALGVEALHELAARAEAAALANKGITKSDSASAGQNIDWVGISSSNGFEGGYAHTGSFLSLAVIGGSGDSMETDSASTAATYFADLESPEAVGQRAASRTLAKLSPRAGKTGQFPIVFERRVSASLLRTLARAVSGPRLAKGTSFLGNKLGQQVFSSGITITDDPLKIRGPRSGPFDGECLPVARSTIIRSGVLESLFLDLRSAARLCMQPTGHASRGLASAPSPSPSNLWIEAGEKSLDEILADIGEGFLVTDLMGASISLSTGDYSRGASGFWVEGGRISHPVSEMTIAGNLSDMFLRMTPASDLEFRNGIDSPSLLIESMTTASR